MSYPHYDADYLLDQYYFQSSVSENSTGLTDGHYAPQIEFSCSWTPSSGSAYLQHSSTLIESGSQQQQLLGVSRSPFYKTSENLRWHSENSGAGAFFGAMNRFDATSSHAGSYTCPTCYKQYCRKSTLKAHLKQHLDYRPFICQACGKSFTQAANLTAHKRVHTGEKPFSCPVCLRPFSQSSSLVTHKRTHTGERPYPCAHCDKAFTDSSTLTKHLRTHTGQKPYQCYMCLMRFTQSGNLHRHMKTHRSQP